MGSGIAQVAATAGYDVVMRDVELEFAEDLGKTTWESDDKPGFVTNRILMPWINEGIRAYDEGVASKDDIDAGMEPRRTSRWDR
ncbi:hypothetical protein A6E15_18025 [Natrinema saccharevitans]|uniref:3-hydroxyacyl-CoA dehydrogenase C-terminal domain-containing protein n=1 Tax=Natrinema saccharevitans TaxID=301967 RepID=A0A1S8ARC7_9EURY|nr:hypothetical protein A6E15_18025 [Natrinema saccharevitans]